MRARVAGQASIVAGLGGRGWIGGNHGVGLRGVWRRRASGPSAPVGRHGKSGEASMIRASSIGGGVRAIRTAGQVAGKVAAWGVVLGALQVAALPAHADTELCEDRYGDAGSLPMGAIRPPGSGRITAINGQIGVPVPADGIEIDTEDLYLVQILAPVEFQAKTVLPLNGDQLDTALWLFDACGHGLLANDNSFEDPTSGFSLLLPFSTPPDRTGTVLVQPGVYYLGLSGTGNIPVSAAGPIFQFAKPTEISGPDGPGGPLPLAQWVQNPAIGEYRIELESVYFLGFQSNCPADLDGSGVVDGADLGVLLANWGPCLPGCNIDLNQDEMVDGADLGVMLGSWGKCPPPMGSTCGLPDAGDCFLANGTPGCENACCCTQLCAIDVFCCEVEWDGLCAAQAVDVCVGGKG